MASATFTSPDFKQLSPDEQKLKGDLLLYHDRYNKAKTEDAKKDALIATGKLLIVGYRDEAHPNGKVYDDSEILKVIFSDSKLVKFFETLKEMQTSVWQRKIKQHGLSFEPQALVPTQVKTPILYQPNPNLVSFRQFAGIEFGELYSYFGEKSDNSKDKKEKQQYSECSDFCLHKAAEFDSFSEQLIIQMNKINFAANADTVELVGKKDIDPNDETTWIKNFVGGNREKKSFVELRTGLDDIARKHQTPGHLLNVIAYLQIAAGLEARNLSLPPAKQISTEVIQAFQRLAFLHYYFAWQLEGKSSAQIHNASVCNWEKGNPNPGMKEMFETFNKQFAEDSQPFYNSSWEDNLVNLAKQYGLKSELLHAIHIDYANTPPSNREIPGCKLTIVAPSQTINDKFCAALEKTYAAKNDSAPILK
jgi:hypothetical protein